MPTTAPITALQQSQTGPRSTAGPATLDFAVKLKLEEADAILRPTGQHETWQHLRRQNDPALPKIADLIIQRHSLLQQARSGQKIDRQLFDKLTDQLRGHQINLFDSTSFPQGEQLFATAPSAPHNSTGNLVPNEDHLQILTLQANGYLLHGGLEAYGDERQLLLPLQDLVDAVDFAILVDPAAGTAEGWFIEESRHFRLDLEKQKIFSGDREFSIPAGSAQMINNQLFLDSELLARIFPINFRHVFQDMTLHLEPREELPFQTRLGRQGQWGDTRRRIGPNQPQLPPFDQKPGLLSVPTIDVAAGKGWRDGTSHYNYNLLGRGDLAKMSSEFYLAGDSRESPRDFRLKLERVDPDSQMFGPLQASRFAVGDINTPNFPLIGSGLRERGVLLEKGDIQHRGVYDTTTLQGNLQPDWDIELYHNNQLISAMRAAPDGSYRFEDVPLYYGRNEFKLISYGPQGQQVVEHQRINVGQDMLRPGETNYFISATEQGAKVYDPTPGYSHQDNNLRLISGLEYGIGPRAGLAAGFASQPAQDARRNYFNLGLLGNFGNTFARGDLVHDDADGRALSLQSQTGIGSLNLRARQELFDNFNSDLDPTHNPRRSTSELSLSGTRRGVGPISSLPYSFTLNHTDHQQSSKTSLGNRLGLALPGVFVSNNLNWNLEQNADETSRTTTGNLQASGFFGPAHLRGQLGYQLGPETKFTDLNLSNFVRFNEKISGSLNLRHELRANGNTSYSAGLNWDTGKVTISPRISHDNRSGLGAFINFSFSLGREPHSGKPTISSQRRAASGAASVLVYHDRNNNRVFDEGDTPIANAQIMAPQLGRKIVTDERGIAQLHNLSPYRGTDLQLDKTSLDDPSWSPATTGRSITPRPGHTHALEFPVITTGEIDGTVLLVNERGEQEEFRNLTVRLLDANDQIIQETKTAYDGFYLFEEVPPGDYRVEIAPDQTRHPNLGSTLAKRVKIGEDGDVRSGINFLAGKIDDQPEPVVLAEASPAPPTISLATAPFAESPAAPKVLPMQPQATQILPRPTKVKPWAAPDLAATEQAPPSVTQTTDRAPAPDSKILASQVEPPPPMEDKRATMVSSPMRVAALTPRRAPALAPRRVPALTPLQRPASAIRVRPATGEVSTAPTYSGAVIKNAGRANSNVHSNAHATTTVTTNATSPVIKGRPSDSREIPVIHLASYRDGATAHRGAEQLRREHGDLLDKMNFEIRKVNLGPTKGIWYRLVVTNPEISEAGAVELSNRLQERLGYSRLTREEYHPGFTLHLGSYRQAGQAQIAAAALQQRHPELLAGLNLAVHRVELPDKGTWYRVIAGNFANPEEMAAKADKLQKNQVEHRIIRLAQN